MRNELRTSFPSLTVNEGLARGIASQFLALLDPTVEELSDIRTAVSEAVTNAVIHGYGRPDGEVYLALYSEGDEVTVRISDRGRGIEDVELARRPFFTTAADGERSGMGFSVSNATLSSIESSTATISVSGLTALNSF